MFQSCLAGDETPAGFVSIYLHRHHYCYIGPNQLSCVLPKLLKTIIVYNVEVYDVINHHSHNYCRICIFL